MARFIEKRRRRWYAVLDVPKDVRDVIGQRRYVKSLETESQTEAERLVLPIVARWKAEFEAIRTGNSVPLEELAKQYRDELLAAKKDPSSTPRSRTGESDLDIYEELLEEKVLSIAETDPVLADRVYQIAKGKTVDLTDHIEPWLAELDNEPKTIDMKRRDVRVFTSNIRFSGDVRRSEVQRWAREYQIAKRLADGTMSRMISACKGFWSYLQTTGTIEREDNPFEGVLSKHKKKAAGKRKRRKGWEPFSPKQVIGLRDKAAAKGDFQLSDAITIAKWTGCRIEEICSLKVSQVLSDRVEIVDAKSEAGDRAVPIHSKLRPHLDRLCASSSDGYVISGLMMNKYGDRSNALGKRFGRMKVDMGYNENQVFHSIRKTVATLLENAGVPENVSADILGHEKQTMTYGLYSGGAGIPIMKDAIEAIDYPTGSQVDQSGVKGRK